MKAIFEAQLVLSVVACLGGATGCGDRGGVPDETADPTRCGVRHLGDAIEAVESGSLPDDALVRVDGIADPRSLVWRDGKTGQAYYIVRVMGTGHRLLYMKPLAVGETPAILSSFEGHVRRWDRWPEIEVVPIAKALRKKYRVEIDPEATYLIKGGASKPAGCP